MDVPSGPPREIEPPLGLRDPAVRWILLLAVGLLAVSWRMQRGYPLADAVEFMDRAQAWVAGEPLTDARTVRSFAFSLIFVPPFLAAKWLGLADQGLVLVAARVTQVLLSLGLILACARLGMRVAGRSAGLAAGVLAALNPVVLQFGVFPVSGIAAALCIAFGLEHLILRPSGTESQAGRPWRAGLLGGLWLGLAFLVAYQSLLVALALFAVLVVRDRWKHRPSWMGLALGLAACLLVQLCLDRAVYGGWQGSLWRYLLENVGYVIVHFLTDVGWDTAARDLYGQISDLRGTQFARDDSVTHATMRFGPLWYVLNAQRFLLWPFLGLIALGIVRALLRPRWVSTVALAALVLTLLVMAKKGDKSLRLMLPLLPLCVPLFSSAWQWCATRAGTRMLARLALVAALPLSLVALAEAKPRAHGAYWDAADWVAARGTESAPPRCAAAYDWATFLRLGAGVDRVKLAAPLERWSALDDPTRQRLREELASLHWLLVHQPVLTAQPALAQELAGEFSVDAAFYDQDEAYELGAVLVLRRQPPVPGDRRFSKFSAGEPRPQHARRLEFRSSGQDEPLVLLGFDVERLDGDGWWWITYHWRLPSWTAELEVRDRVSSPDERNSWQNDHRLAWGAPWPEGGGFLSEGFLFVPSAVDAVGAKRFRPLGGAYRRGELLPLSAWMEVRDRAGGTPLAVCRPGEDAPVAAELSPELAALGWRWTLDGYRFSIDDLARVGSFLLPVHPRAFARDDGKPVRE